MSIFDELLGQVAQNVDIKNLAAKVGLTPEQVEIAVSALGAAAEIHTSGLDVAIVAFDEFPLSHTQSGPVLVIEHDDRAMGAMAARLLFERLADPGRATRHIIVDTSLRIH